jgi:bifunctional UDP-N-acetylglucosamine pyrophosphorylase / glucosamine-1-phosphate N-acetyltransferase
MVAIAVLAAGRGTRMKSNLPKVLHRLGGRSLLEWALESATGINPTRQIVIVGYRGDWVRESLAQRAGIEFVDQIDQLGTGHAVQQVMPLLQRFDDHLLVLNGDVPLLRPQTLKLLLDTHVQHGNAATLLTAQIPDPKGYGRVLCDGNQILKQIIEDRDCTPAQRQNRRINAGVYCFHWPRLAQVLPQLEANNDQQEYYLTDAVNFLSPVMVVDVEDYQEILGVNDRKQLAQAYTILQDRIKDHWMAAGVTLIDPASITIEPTVELQPDVVIEPQTHLRGKTVIQSGSRIGPMSLIENSQIEQDVTVFCSVIRESCIRSGTTVGPYAHLRGSVEVGSGCRIGNFVELKNTTLGKNTNVAHLSYLGDTSAGNQVNIGGGTITANYDGIQKHRTQIGDRSKTGVNNSLVAPLRIEADVTIAAGSTITENVPADSLVIARARQVVKPGWRLHSAESAPDPSAE